MIRIRDKFNKKARAFQDKPQKFSADSKGRSFFDSLRNEIFVPLANNLIDQRKCCSVLKNRPLGTLAIKFQKSYTATVGSFQDNVIESHGRYWASAVAPHSPDTRIL